MLSLRASRVLYFAFYDSFDLLKFIEYPAFTSPPITSFALLFTLHKFRSHSFAYCNFLIQLMFFISLSHLSQVRSICFNPCNSFLEFSRLSFTFVLFIQISLRFLQELIFQWCFIVQQLLNHIFIFIEKAAFRVSLYIFTF